MRREREEALNKKWGRRETLSIKTNGCEKVPVKIRGGVPKEIANQGGKKQVERGNRGHNILQGKNTPQQRCLRRSKKVFLSGCNWVEICR